MCDISGPLNFVTVTYKLCEICGEAFRTFLLIPKVGPLPELDGHRGIYYIEIPDLSLIDDWKVELALAKQEITPVNLGKYKDYLPWELSLCLSTDLEFGVVSEEQLSRSRNLFQTLNAELSALRL